MAIVERGRICPDCGQPHYMIDECGISPDVITVFCGNCSYVGYQDLDNWPNKATARAKWKFPSKPNGAILRILHQRGPHSGAKDYEIFDRTCPNCQSKVAVGRPRTGLGVTLECLCPPGFALASYPLLVDYYDTLTYKQPMATKPASNSNEVTSNIRWLSTRDTRCLECGYEVKQGINDDKTDKNRYKVKCPQCGILHETDSNVKLASFIRNLRERFEKEGKRMPVDTLPVGITQKELIEMNKIRAFCRACGKKMGVMQLAISAFPYCKCVEKY